MAVPGGNRTLFRCVLRTHCRVRITVTQYFRYGRSSYALCKLMNTCHVYTVRIGPTLNGSSALQRFERGNVLRNNVRFLPGTATYVWNSLLAPLVVKGSLLVYQTFNTAIKKYLVRLDVQHFLWPVYYYGYEMYKLSITAPQNAHKKLMLQALTL